MKDSPGTDSADEPWDLVVIGGGTAGIVGARTAAALGARVLLVERDRTGGDCLWTGCVPSKALLAAAEVAATARNGARLGVDVDGISVDFARVMAHVRASIEEIAPVDSPETLTSAGVAVRHGHAVLTGPDRLQVDGADVGFTQALLATGAAPTVPDLARLAEVPHLTSDTVWDLEELPADLLVLGGGATGCELAQAFARLGSRVTLVEAGDRLLPGEDPDAAAMVAGALAEDGVRLRVGSAATGVEPGAGPGSGSLVLADGERIGFTRLLLATGRTPRVRDLGLDRAFVELHGGHVRVDQHLRTTNRRVWAAGDLTGHPQYTHTAGVHASIAAANAVLGVRRTVDPASNPRVTFTQPEVAAVGASSAAPAHGHRVLDLSHRHVDRAVTAGDTSGMTRLVLDARGRIVGATVVGPRAGETIGEVTLAVKQGLRTRDLAGVTHPYPTWNDGLWNATILDAQGRLARPTTRRVLGAAARARRWWLARRAGNRLAPDREVSRSRAAGAP